MVLGYVNLLYSLQIVSSFIGYELLNAIFVCWGQTKGNVLTESVRI